MSAASMIPCRLCVTTSDDFESLYDEEGQANDLHALTCDYFHPKIVDMEKAKHLTVICLECFRHLQDFHSFQSCVMAAQIRLAEMEEGKTINTIAEELQTSQGNILTPTIAIKVEGEYISEYGTEEFRSPEDYKNILDNNSQSIHSEVFHHEDEEEHKKSIICTPKLELIDVDTVNRISLTYDAPNGSPVSNTAVSERIEQMRRKKYETLEELIDKSIPIKNCTKCPQTFPCWRELKDHFKQQHPHQEYQFTCCSRQFTRYTIKDHLRLHVDPDAFKCDLCGKCYTSSNNLTGHKADIHPESFRYSCGICAKRCSSENGLAAHYRDMHNTDRKDRPKIQLLADGRTAYICQLCGQIQYTGSAFRTHISKRHRALSSQQVCEICSKTCRNNREYREHLAVHQNKKLYKCAYCSRTYTTLSGVFDHRKKQHPQESNKNCYVNISESNTMEKSKTETHVPSTSAKDNSDVKNLKPNEGVLVKTNTSAMSTEIRAKTESATTLTLPKLEIMDVNSETENASDDEIPLLQLQQADKSYSTAKGYDSLQESLDPEDSGDCSTTDNPQRPGLHDLLKKWMPNIKCPICPISYTKLDLLKNHFRQMHSYEAFYVSCCSRQFNSRDRLRDHLMMHNDPNAYKCKFCGKCYHSNANLNVHLNQKHSESHHKIACKLCGKRFHLIKGLASHMKLMHKKVKSS